VTIVGLRAARGQAARGAAAVLLTALALAACGGGGHPRPGAATATPSPAATTTSTERGAQPAPGGEAELEALLARRARALGLGRPRAYAATSTGAQRREDRAIAGNAAALPLRHVSLTILSASIAKRRATLQVRSSYGIKGIGGRYETDRTLRAVRTRHGWRIRAETSRRRRQPWEVAPFAARRSRHFVVLHPAAQSPTGLLTALEDGYGRMKGVLPKARLRRRYLVVVAGDTHQARRMTAGIRGVASLAAISDTSLREEGEAQRVTHVSSQRLLVVWPAFAPLGEDGRRRVVAHELTHASLAGVTSGRTPSWLVEGVAMYVSGDRRAQEAAGFERSASAARRSLALAALSKPGAIARLGGDRQAAAYAFSSAAVFYVAEHFGRRRLFRLYDTFNRDSLTGSPGAGLAGKAVQRTLGVSLQALDRDVTRTLGDR
jgi:hypothetical protein